VGQKRLVKIDWLVSSRADAHDPGTGILAKTVVVRWELWVPMPSITSAGCLVQVTIVPSWYRHTLTA